MKIEMAESLLRSWLRHVEGCQVAELNWKPSSAWGFDPNDTVSNLFDHAVINFPKVIKKNTLSQFIKQAEIDVLGIKIGAEGKVDKIYAFDSAFHTGGLNYGSAEETRNRVQKKLFRTALLLESYFPSVPACVEFVAPMASPAIHNRVTEATELVRENLKVLSHIQFEYTGREAFAEKFLHPLLDLKSDIADTSELFMRSWQLVESFLTAARKSVV